jgi:hypothetical protein
VAFLFASVAIASSFPRVDQDIKAYDDHIVQMEAIFKTQPVNPNSKTWVAAKLAHMVEVDQYMRKYVSITFTRSYSEDERKEFWKQFGPRFARVDSKHTSDLKELLKIYPWFTISEFGAQTDQNAWLLVQHADLDPAFQKSVLKILTELYPKGETSPSNYAYLFDRVAASWHSPSQRTLQRYGTQGKCVGPQKWEPLPIEDSQRLDERRQSVGLGPESDYIKQVQQVCY